jgi:cellulose synthase (UDP-forming)
MFEKTLAACARIRYPHTTYLLDDTRDPRFAELAERHGAVYLEIVDVPGAKAGKINAALAITHEEFVLVLDPDHVPFPEFFDHVLGYFREPEVGFVQVCQAYYNQPRSGVARGAAEQTYGFYGPTQMGMGGLGTPLVIGANCTFRREALESIGGHGIGLAEDLVTAIRLHAAGWKGIYTPTILSRGLVPETLPAFLHQQLKWARGVYEVLFSEFPRAFARLSFFQRLAHLGVGTYYLTGLATLVYLTIPQIAIWFGVFPVDMSFSSFLVRGAPVAFAGVALHFFGQRFYCQPAKEAGFGFHGTSLKASSFFVFCQGLALGLSDRFLRYVPTEKRSVARRTSGIAAPALVVFFAVLAGAAEVTRRVLVGHPEAATSVAMLVFALISLTYLLPGLYWALFSPPLPARDAWDELLEP